MSEAIPSRVRRRVRVQGNQGSITTGTTRKISKETISDDEHTERFVGAEEISPAYVTIGGRVTKNLGNYESVQISVSVTLPCAPTEAAVKDTQAKASSLVDERMETELGNLDQVV